MAVVSLPASDWVEEVGPVDGVDFVVNDLSGPSADDGHLEVAVPPYLGGWNASLLTAMPELRLVQTLTAGYDGILEHLPSGVVLANAAGVHDASTAELAVGLALASLRGIPDFVLAQQDGRWLPTVALRPSLADSRVLVVGYGSIGRAIASRLAPFEVSLTAVAGRRRPGDDLVDQVHGVDELPELLPDHDVVVVIVPLTEATERLVNDDFLSRMPDGAVLVNVARGRVADTDALVRHAGRLRIALDVTEPEPLPPDHPLWRAPGVLLSPHTGGATTAFRPRAVRLLRDQLGRLVAGEPLRNVVHPGATEVPSAVE